MHVGKADAAWRENGGDLTGFGRSNESEGRSERASERQMQGERERGMNSTFSSVFATATEQTDGHSDKEGKEGEGE